MLIKQHGLTADDLVHARKLQDLCNLHGGLDLPLNLDPGRPGEPTNQFIFYDRDEKPVGVLTLQVGREVEVCLAVHPGYRRRGIGRALLAAAVEECRRRGTAELLLVCDDASPPGRAFASSAGAAYRYSEYRMRLDPELWRAQAQTGVSVELRQAGLEHAGLLARLIGASFGHPVEQERERVAHDLSRSTHRFYVAHAGGEPVGCAGVVTVEERRYVIALGVRPEHRGKRYGRSILKSIVAMLVEEGRTEIFVEVEAENRGALSLYRSCGFRETASYGFYRVPMS